MKKKIVIITTNAAGGQTAVSKALMEQLQGCYNLSSASIFDDILSSVDIVKKCTGGMLTGEKLYNFIARKKWNWFINTIFYKVGVFYYNLWKKTSTRLFLDYFEKEKPDLVISVTPFINSLVFHATKAANLPFLIVSPDFDPTIYLYGLPKKEHPGCYLSIPHKDATINALLNHYQFPQETVTITRYPLRKSFTQTYFDKKELKKKYGIKNNQPVLLVMLGSLSAPNLFSFVQEINNITTPLHLLICTGSSDEMFDKISALPFPDHISHHIFHYTDNIAELMAIADLFITKSGSVSVAEAIYMNIPMLLDATSPVLVWEEYNHMLVTENNLGYRITNTKKLPQLITNLLKNNTALESMKKNSIRFNKKQHAEAVSLLIKQILIEHTSAELIPLHSS